MIADYPRAVTELESDKISPIQLTISRIFWPEIVLRMKKQRILCNRVQLFGMGDISGA